jgi:hypothetical protein
MGNLVKIFQKTFFEGPLQPLFFWLPSEKISPQKKNHWCCQASNCHKKKKKNQKFKK